MTWEYRSIVIAICRVTKHVHHNPRRHALGEQQRRARVPQIVEPDSPYSSRCDQLVEEPALVSGLDHRPDRRCEDKPGFRPPCSESQGFRRLAGAMRTENLDPSGWKRNRPARPTGLGAAVDEPDLKQPLHIMPDVHESFVQVDVRPAQRQQLAASRRRRLDNRHPSEPGHRHPIHRLRQDAHPRPRAACRRSGRRNRVGCHPRRPGPAKPSGLASIRGPAGLMWGCWLRRGGERGGSR